ncbi:MAG TPA: class I SAM-dependent methyltransferase [Solirubrobacteraceae bacterium]|nr:class I SAM-dependent methyltransferase [Solirubrobacteraceae bacterium]
MDPYGAIASAYGSLTADYDYDRWLAVIEANAREAGMGGSRLLDVACGSGSSFLPLLDRFDVTACDLSEAMLDEARLRVGDDVRLFRQDMRALPVIGEFDLVLCLDDALNHLLSPAELQSAFAGIARNLAPTGVAVFDLNTLLMFRTTHSTDTSFIVGGAPGRELVLWRGDGPADLEPGGLTGVRIDVLAPEDGKHYRRQQATIVERHHPLAQVRAALDSVGMRVFRCLGQSTGVQMSPTADELLHTKALFVVHR